MRRWAAIAILLVWLAACSPEAPPRLAETRLLPRGTVIEQPIDSTSNKHRWAFTGSTGDILNLTARFEGFVPQLVLTGPDEVDMTLDFSPAASSNSDTFEKTLILPADGAYALSVTANGNDSGSYSIFLQEPSPEPLATAYPSPTALPEVTVPPPTPPSTPTPAYPLASSGARLNPRQPLTGRFESTGNVDRFTIFAEAGTAISVEVTASEDTAIRPDISLYNPAGELLAQRNAPDDSQTVTLDDMSLDTTGAYVVFVRDVSGQNTGTYTITYGTRSTPLDRHLGSLAPDAPASGVLSSSTGQDVWQLDLESGATISAAAVVDQDSTLLPELSMITLDGRIVAASVGTSDDRNAVLRSVAVPETGRYLLAVHAADPMQLGAYTLIWRYETGTQ